MIEPVAARLNIPVENIFANTLIFDESGKYSSFDANEPTSKDGGKPKVVQMWEIHQTLLHNISAVHFYFLLHFRYLLVNQMQ